MRMGAPKATIELRGRALIEYPLAAFAAARIETVVVAKRQTPLPDLGVPVWREQDEPTHPLHGIVTAFDRAAGTAVVVCGCDMPFVSAELLAHLAEREEPLVVPRVGSKINPLLGRYGLALADSLRAQLDAGRSLHDIVTGLGAHFLGEHQLQQFGDPDRLLFNVNTPADLAQAEALLA